jgi:CubicO group peptidase (beta-lactamase class C family)
MIRCTSAANLLPPRLALLLCIAAGALQPATAQDASRQLADHPRVADAVRAWEEWVEYQAAMDAVPGVSLGIVHDQELIAAHGFGFANPETGLPATPETLYSICSISKLFTSVAVMQQRDAGRLRLSDPVADHLPWFTIEDAHPEDGPITIAGILSHSAGLPRESDYPYWTGTEGYPFPTHDQIVARIDEQATLYPASRYYQYSNLGLTLAGEIVSAVSGEPFGDYIRSNILDPLDMANTFTDVPVQLRGTRLAVGHTARKRDGSRPVAEPFQTRGIAPAAGFASSVLDLARFAMWQNRLLADGGEEVLRASTLREMHRVWWVDPDWETTRGLGFAVSREGDRTFVSHGGGCPGYYTHFRLEPKSKMAAIALTNSIGSEVSFYTLKALDLIAPAVEEALDEDAEPTERDPSLDRYTGVYESIWGEAAIVRWKEGLGYLWLDTRDPAGELFELKKTGEHTFRLVRKDDEAVLGQEFLFEIAEDGTVTRFLTHSNWYTKIR